MYLDGVHSLIKKAQEIPDLFLSSDDRLSTEAKVYISIQVVAISPSLLLCKQKSLWL